MGPVSNVQRLRLFLYSTGNIVGCLLALGGLALFFSGIIDSWWWAIVAGLYGVGVLGWPRSELANRAIETELSTETLAQQVRKLVDSVAGGLPKDALDRLRSIQATLSELLPRLEELKNRGIISAKDSFTVIETVPPLPPRHARSLPTAAQVLCANAAAGGWPDRFTDFARTTPRVGYFPKGCRCERVRRRCRDPDQQRAVSSKQVLRETGVPSLMQPAVSDGQLRQQ